MKKTKYILTLAFTLTSIVAWSQSIITIREICVEDCADGVDGDNDGLSDCQDMDCIDYFKQQFLFKSNSDSTYCNIDVIQDTIVTWSDCIDILIAGIIDTTAIPLDSIQCIRYDPMDSSCGSPNVSCSSSLLCPQNSCGDYFVSLIGSNNQVLTSEVVHIKEREVDYDLLRCAFPGTDSLRLVEVAAAFNLYKDQFEINTPLRIAHFLGQVGVETAGLSKLQENCNYSPKGMICVFGGLPKYGSLFQGYNSDQDTCIGNRPATPVPAFPYNSKLDMLIAWSDGAEITFQDGRRFRTELKITYDTTENNGIAIIDTITVIDTIYAQNDIKSSCDLCSCNGNPPRLNVSSNYNNGNLRSKPEYIRSCDIFDVTYSCRLGNGPPGSGDGSAYAGIGFLHLTGKEKIKFVQDAWDADPTNANNPKDFYGDDAHELWSNIDVAMKASMYYWISRTSNGHAANYWADRNNYFRVAAVVNNPTAGDSDDINGYADRVNRTNHIFNNCLNSI